MPFLLVRHGHARTNQSTNNLTPQPPPTHDVTCVLRLLVATARKGYGGLAALSSGSEMSRLGVGLAKASCVVAGLLLQQTVAGVLPREQRDAEAEWAHKFGPSSGARRKGGGAGSSGLLLFLDAMLHKGPAGRYARTQLARIAALVAGWGAMTALHWPELFASSD